MRVQLLDKKTGRIIKEWKETADEFERWGPFDEHGAPRKTSILWATHAELRGECLRLWLEPAN